MRPLRAVPCVLALACLFPVVSLADDFSDYRIPDHFGGSWSASFDGTASSRSENQKGTASRDRRIQGRLGGRWDRFHDSDRRQWEIGLQGTVRGDRRTARLQDFSDDPGPPPTSASTDIHSRDRSVNEALRVFAAHRAYPWALPVGWDVQGVFQLQDDQIVDDRLQVDRFDSFSEFRSESSSQNVAWRYEEAASLALTLGVGRVRDATPVFQAILLEERLRQDGALAHPLSPASRQRIADLYSTRFDFSIPHDLPEKFFWRELESALRQEGALADSGFDAYTIQHADDVLVVARSGFSRPVGWFFGPTLSLSHQHRLLRLDQRSRFVHFTDGTQDADFSSVAGQRQRDFVDLTFYGVRGEYDRPLGPRTQLSLSEVVSIELSSDPDRLQVGGIALLQRLVAERWFAQVAATHSRFVGGDPDFSTWFARVGGSVSYFLEDFMQAGLDLSQDWESVQELSMERRRSVGFSTRLFVSFGRGRLDAPGLITPQRALH